MEVVFLNSASDVLIEAGNKQIRMIINSFRIIFFVLVFTFHVTLCIDVSPMFSGDYIQGEIVYISAADEKGNREVKYTYQDSINDVIIIVSNTVSFFVEKGDRIFVNRNNVYSVFHVNQIHNLVVLCVISDIVVIVLLVHAVLTRRRLRNENKKSEMCGTD